MNMERGEVKQEYSNTNGKLTFFENGAIRVTIDSQSEGAKANGGHNEQLWLYYSNAMRDMGIMTNAECHRSGIANTYTIPSGANGEIVLDGLRKSTFINDEEKSRLNQMLRSHQTLPFCGNSQKYQHAKVLTNLLRC